MLDVAIAGAVALYAMQGPSLPALRPVQVRATRTACSRQAARQGLSIRGQGTVQAVTGSGGFLIGAETILRVSRRGQRYSVRCSYGFNDRVARITPLQDRPTPVLTAGQQACTAQAQRQGLAVRGSRSTRTMTGSGGRPISEEVIVDVTRAGRSYQVRCNYGFADGVARITAP